MCSDRLYSWSERKQMAVDPHSINVYWEVGAWRCEFRNQAGDVKSETDFFVWQFLMYCMCGGSYIEQGRCWVFDTQVNNHTKSYEYISSALRNKKTRCTQDIVHLGLHEYRHLKTSQQKLLNSTTEQISHKTMSRHDILINGLMSKCRLLYWNIGRAPYLFVYTKRLLFYL